MKPEIRSEILCVASYSAERKRLIAAGIHFISRDLFDALNAFVGLKIVFTQYGRSQVLVAVDGEDYMNAIEEAAVKIMLQENVVAMPEWCERPMPSALQAGITVGSNPTSGTS